MCEIRANAEQLAFMDLPHPKTAEARRVLRGPPLPGSLAYLLEWLFELRAGVAPVPMVGLVRFSWADLTAWSHYTGNTPTAQELALLREIEGLLLTPPDAMPVWDD